MQTEQSNPNTREIDRLSTLDMLTAINQEDRKVAEVVGEAIPAIGAAVDAIVERLQRGGRLIYVGAGTSGRLGVLDAVECVPTYGVSPELVQGVIAGGFQAIIKSIEGAEDDRSAARHDLGQLHITANDAIVGIAASGRTPYVLEAMVMAKEIKALTVGISCNAPAPLLDEVEYPIAAVVGPEVIAGSTRMKAGTAQKLILNMMSTGVMIKLGKVYGNLMVDVQATNQKLVGRARNLVMQIADVDAETTAELLNQAGQNVKVAIVMHREQLSADEARQKLALVNGRLRDVIG